MWSGPRNLSTAMMYAFGARDDCAVLDEPFYAVFLKATGLDHPFRQEVLATMDSDSEKVIARCLGPVPESKKVFYQKHMTQHMVKGVDRSWIRGMTNVFLIRHPARVIASYAVKRENPTLEDIGFVQQYEIFDSLCQNSGTAPPVMDSAEIRKDPAAQLAALCAAIDLPFQPAMLNWPKGGHKSDGIWAPHWYASVWNSTGFAEPEGPLPEVPDALMPVLEAALPIYEKLSACRLQAAN